MLGSQLPGSNDNGGDGSSMVGLISSIEEIFTLILETLSDEIDSIDDPQSDVLAALWKARFVAERGLRMSERLSERFRGESDIAAS